MKRCPACNARYRGKEECHRCGMNIAPLLEIKTCAHNHFKRAIQSYCVEDYENMYTHARRANSLYQTRETMQVFACASILVKRFEEAIKTWQQYSNCQPFCSR
jgi:hypothetical protein